MKTRILLLSIFSAFILLYGCNEDPVNDPLITEKGNGVVVLKITDAPFPFENVEKALVTVDWVKLKKAGIPEGVGDDDPNSFIVIFEKDTVIDLLQLSNGVTHILSKVEVPKGEYSEIRMNIKESGVKIVDVAEVYSLKIPSGSSSGLKIKINPTLVVPEGKESELVVDVDVSRSFKIIGNDNGKKGIKGFMFNPVVRAAAASQAGKIEGTVTSAADNSKINNALVYLVAEKTENGITVSDTISTAKTTAFGHYAIIGVAPGTYKMDCSAKGFKPLTVFPSVVIEKGKTTTQTFNLERN